MACSTGIAIWLIFGIWESRSRLDCQLHYVWCNTACFDGNASDWCETRIGLPDNQGEGVDLALDGNNRRRMAYEMGGAGLCLVQRQLHFTNGWQTSTAEATSVIIAQYPELPVYSCPIQTWFNGKRPSLALDSGATRASATTPNTGGAATTDMAIAARLMFRWRGSRSFTSREGQI